MVRMGDLSWDAFEPAEGHFEFAWFDQILEQMNQAGIKVILDIGGSPAPSGFIRNIHRSTWSMSMARPYSQQNATWTTSVTRPIAST